MPRTKRATSESGIYHVMLRGINQQQIFHEETDCQKFLKLLETFKAKSHFNLFAYCFMGNHIHLLLQETDESISLIIKRIGSAYVLWYNNKYKRSGHLFQDRFKSEAVEDDAYFISVLSYIHNNPVQAGLVKHPKDYALSSYRSYINNYSLVSSDFLWGIIDKEQFEAIHLRADANLHMDIPEQIFHINDEQAQDIIEKYSGCKTCEQYQKLPYQQQLLHLSQLKANGLSIRQISRLTGLPKGVVEWHTKEKLKDF